MSYELLLFILFIGLFNAQVIHSGHTHEVKHGYKQPLCGDTFIHVWKAICKFKANSVSKKRAKRSIEDMIKLRSIDLLPSRGALQFLKPRRKRRQVLIGGLDNADEECCKETCTFSEVAEYAC